MVEIREQSEYEVHSTGSRMQSREFYELILKHSSRGAACLRPHSKDYFYLLDCFLSFELSPTARFLLTI
jgi:hypothetical protein